MAKIDKGFFIVDFKDVQDNFRGCCYLFEIYPRYPLNDIISDILHMPCELDCLEYIYDRINEKFWDEELKTDLDDMGVSLEALVHSVDERVQKYCSSDYYLFSDWVDFSSALLEARPERSHPDAVSSPLTTDLDQFTR